MKLSDAELQTIQSFLYDLDLKYQEIFDEMLDHFVCAAEDRRDKNPDQPIKEVLEEIVVQDFGAKWKIKTKVHDIRESMMRQANTYFNQLAKKELINPVFLVGVNIIAFFVLKISMLLGYSLITFITLFLIFIPQNLD